MINRIIFHLPFRPDSNRASASQIRPLKMLQAFKNIGYEVDVIMGTSMDRKKQIKEIEAKMKQGVKYKFLYSESSTMPTLLTDKHHLPLHPFLDFEFFKKCKNQGIPIGLFYRDIHWRFSHYEKETSSLKRTIATCFYKYDLSVYKKIVDVLFLPSLGMKRYITELENIEIVELPPGTIKRSDNDVAYKTQNTAKTIKLIYVGGLGKLYDLQLLCSILVKMEGVHLTICCRREEYLKEKENYSKFVGGNVSFVHCQGDELVKLYGAHDAACVFVKPTTYWEFAMPVKLFEYISFMKPILAVQGTSVGDFVKKNNIGWSVPYEENAISNWLAKLEMDDIYNFKESVRKALVESTWEARAAQVEKSLIK